MEEGLVKRLIASVKCDSCGQHYEEDNIAVMEHSDELWFLMIRCSSCQAKCLVAALISEDKAAEVITDLTEAERDKFERVDGVSVDDMLDMHNYLKGFNGNFLRLLRHQ